MSTVPDTICAPVRKFITALTALPALSGVFNPWRDYDARYDQDETAPSIRAYNLTHYLAERVGRAKLVLIGEAPGFRGCKFSGIAMTSERILLGKQRAISPENVFLGLKRRTSASFASFDGFIEPTASIVWSLLLQLDIDPRDFILWNAFPCHPYKGAERLTNRKPLPGELAATAHILPALLELSPKTTVVAVGRVAEGALNTLALKYSPVRHPAMGGANAFRAGIKALLKRSA